MHQAKKKIKCPECKKTILLEQDVCPKCGFDLKKYKEEHPDEIKPLKEHYYGQAVINILLVLCFGIFSYVLVNVLYFQSPEQEAIHKILNAVYNENNDEWSEDDIKAIANGNEYFAPQTHRDAVANAILYSASQKLLELDGDQANLLFSQAEEINKSLTNNAKKANLDKLSELAWEAYTDNNYFASLSLYDLIYKVSSNNVDNDKFNIAIKTYFTDLLFNNQIDSAWSLIEDHKNIIGDEAASKYETQVAETKNCLEKAETVLSKAYQYMSQRNFDEMINIDGSTDANAAAHLLNWSNIIFDGNSIVSNPKQYTGKGIAICRLPRTGYYFYFGDFVNGTCSGSGYSFCKEDDDKYKTYEGSWSQNSPDGSGTYTYCYTNEKIKRIVTGSFTNGYMNGLMSMQHIYPEGDATASFTASMGTAPDIYPSLSSEYKVTDTKQAHKAGIIIYAVFDLKHNKFNYSSFYPYTTSLGVFGKENVPNIWDSSKYEKVPISTFISPNDNREYYDNWMSLPTPLNLSTDISLVNSSPSGIDIFSYSLPEDITYSTLLFNEYKTLLKNQRNVTIEKEEENSFFVKLEGIQLEFQVAFTAESTGNHILVMIEEVQ